jgi:putative ABC transport system ATP-binding protein
VPEPDPIVIADGLCAEYGDGDLRVPVLEGVSFEVARGSVTAITGPSGSGKTTLLSLVGALDRPTRGRLVVDGADLTAMGNAALTEFRRRRVGFVFQAFHLLPALTVLENVEAGLEPLGLPRREAQGRAHAALEAAGLGALHHRFPSELSGGEQQRVAVARACAKDPPLLLADEPTGNLDEETGERVIDLLLGAARGRRTVLVVTHNPSIAARADCVLALHAHRVEVAVRGGATP